MKRHYMTQKHNPPTSYGDCFRACLASILEVDDVTHVPHFHSDGCTDDAEITDRVNDYLRTYHALQKFGFAYFGGFPLDELLKTMAINNPDVNYILFGQTPSGEPHAVVCRNAEIVHDPSPWLTGGIVGPDQGVWSIIILIPEILCYE